MQTMGSGSIGETRRSGFKSQCSHQPPKFLFRRLWQFMRTQITEVSIFQNAKFLAVLYLPIGLIYTVMGIIFLAYGIVVAGIIFILAPIWLSLMTFVMVALFSVIYNLVASKIGGVEFELTEMREDGNVPKDNFGY